MLAEQWRSVGIEQGDTVLIHANSIRAMVALRRAGVSATPENILASFIDAVGDTGTLLFPLFNFGFSSGQPFDLRTTPSQMGALSEAARLHPVAIRTAHPIYSFAVIGPQKERFAQCENISGYAADSPFGLLKELGGKIALLDVNDQGAMTYYHHIEEIMRVDYRYFKFFTGNYTDASGHTSSREYSLYVRDIDRGVVTDVVNAGELLWQQGLYHGDRPNQKTGLRWIYATEMFNAISTLIKQNKAEGMLYRIEKND
nr:AAC(3) family N-acetyltransferase [uncultured Tolumonas sp.]